MRLAHHTRSNLSLVVDHNGPRDDVAETKFVQCVEVRASPDVEADVEPMEEWFDFASVLLLVDRHGEKLNIFARVCLRERRESRQFVLAWLALVAQKLSTTIFRADWKASVSGRKGS